MLEQALGQAGVLEGGGEALGAERRLGGMLEDHGIAGHQRRHDAVDRGEIGIVPGCHDEDDAQRLPADETGEAGPRVGRHVAQRSGRDLDHVAGALLEAAHLAGRLADGAADLARQLLGDLLLMGDEVVHRLGDDAAALGDRHMLPVGLGLARGGEGIGDLFLCRQLAGDKHAAVDRRDGLLDVGHGDRSSLRNFLAARWRRTGATVGGRLRRGNAARPPMPTGELLAGYVAAINAGGR